MPGMGQIWSSYRDKAQYTFIQNNQNMPYGFQKDWLSMLTIVITFQREYLPLRIFYLCLPQYMKNLLMIWITLLLVKILEGGQDKAVDKH